MDWESFIDMEEKQNDVAVKKEKTGKVWFIVMIVAIIILLPLLIVNLTLIIKGTVNPDVPPDIFGIAPMAVESGSMEGDNADSFNENALIFVRILGDDEKKTLKENDVITFVISGTYITHRIIGVNYDENGVAESYLTKGDANDSPDRSAVDVGNVIGKYVGSIDGLGGFALFLQTSLGILIFIGIPVLIYIAYDVTRIVLHNRQARQQEGEMIARQNEEIERLKALVESRDAGGGQTSEDRSSDKEETSEDNQQK